MIDASDGDAVAVHPWQLVTPANRDIRYAQASFGPPGNKETVSLHLFLWRLWGLPPAEQIDHKNRNGLDCRRANLRPATYAKNQANKAKSKNCRSGFKGVSWQHDMKRWRATIAVDGKKRSIGWFDTPEEAHAAYLAAAREAYGDYARSA